MTENHLEPEHPDAQVRALSEALDAEKEARRIAEAANAAKSELLATVSHEVRTPMGAIISMADLLLATHLNSTQRHYADTLQQSARGLLAVLNDILDYSKLEAGRFELEPVAFDFRELMESVASAVAAQAHEKGLTSRLELALDCPTQVVADPVRLRQILNNLTDNAIKFTETGSVSISARCAVEGKEAVVGFDVADTGIGLTEEQITRLFQPYAQVDSSVATTYGGTGLGLSIARRLAELMDGELTCASVRGRGSVFRFTARVRLAESGTETAKPGGSGAAIAGALHGHVLIVEDNAVNEMLIAAYLEKFGVTSTAVKSGREALRTLRSAPVDLVLMDIMMPEMDGIEATRRIRALEGDIAKVPVVALTANAMKGDRESYLAAGMDGYVSKPISAQELFGALQEHLGAAPARRAVGA